MKLDRALLLRLVVPIALIWAGAAVFMGFAERSYESQWTLLLPGTGVGSAINLESIGQASSSVSSSYVSQSLDPKKNYQAIAASQPVVERAARELDLHPSALRPRVKTREQTALIEFSVRSHSPEVARRTGQTLLRSFELTLDELRKDEMQHRESKSVAFIEGYRSRVDQTQATLLEYQQDNSTLSSAQFETTQTQLLDLRQDLRTLKADLAAREAALASLTRTLSLTPADAQAALRLETDPVLAPVMRTWGEARSELAVMAVIWGPNHPQRRKLEDRMNSAAKYLSMALPGTPIERMAELSLRTEGGQSSQKDRSALFAELIRMTAEHEAESARAGRLASEADELALSLEQERHTAAMLDSLTREHQVASAVFSSALAKVDLGKSDPYASYPLVQVLMPPSLPQRPVSPNLLIVLFGTVFASILVIAGYLLCLLIEKRPELLGLKPQSSGSSR